MGKIKEGSENYACTVVQIAQIFDIQGADRIKRVVVEGNSVIVSNAVESGDVMLYFVSGTRLAEDFCFDNNLYDSPEMNKNTEERGYISHKQRRVKALKLRGVISDGMLMPLSSTKGVYGNSELKVGDSFTEINGIDLCEKYVVATKYNNSTPQQAKVNKMAKLIVDNQFRLHGQTEHFVKNLSNFNLDTEVIISRKMHGSSLILAKVLINKKMSLFSRFLNKLGLNIPTSEYGVIWSSGKPKSKMPKGLESKSNRWETPNQSFYTSDIWARAYKELKDKLEVGISLYGEIVGEGVQGEGYTYGKEFAVYIYRITFTSIDGNVYEFSWEQIKAYCEKYGINHVEEYFVGKVHEIVGKNGTNEDLLARLQEAYLDKSYPDCVVDEGVCIRVRNSDEIFKLKSPNFILHENKEAEEGVENIEDAQ